MNEIHVEQPTLFDVPHVAPPIEYELLKGHFRTGGSFKTDEQLRSEYVQLTDDLIYKMTEGVSVKDLETGETRIEKPDYVIWLDKSARPVAWLAKDLWPTLAADKDGHLPKMPKFRFVNIDREQWVTQVDPEGVGHMDIDRVDQSIIRSLRSIFVSVPNKQQGLTEEIDTAPSELDNKTIMIVDEVRSTGRTLDIAEKFFKRAFPTTKVATAHWMKSLVAKDMAVGNADLPVWYKEKDVQGRGVGNRDEVLSRSSPSRTQRLGSWFLSTRLSDPSDPSSRQLRKELSQLAKDAHDGKILVMPSLDRDADDYEDRAVRLNSLQFEEFLKKKEQLTTQG